MKQCQTEVNCCNLRESNLYVREGENKQKHREESVRTKMVWEIPPGYKKLLLYINAEHTMSLTEAYSKAENTLAERGKVI